MDLYLDYLETELHYSSVCTVCTIFNHSLGVMGGGGSGGGLGVRPRCAPGWLRKPYPTTKF